MNSAGARWHEITTLFFNFLLTYLFSNTFLYFYVNRKLKGGGCNSVLRAPVVNSSRCKAICCQSFFTTCLISYVYIRLILKIIRIQFNILLYSTSALLSNIWLPVLHINIFLSIIQLPLRFRFSFMVFNATFNNMSVILAEETGVPGENHQPAESH